MRVHFNVRTLDGQSGNVQFHDNSQPIKMDQEQISAMLSADVVKFQFMGLVRKTRVVHTQYDFNIETFIVDLEEVEQS